MDTKGITSPLQLKYISILKVFLWPMGAWPAHMFGNKATLLYRVQRIFLPIFVSVIIFGEIYYIRNHYKTISIFVFGQALIVCFLSFFTLARVCLPNFKTYDIIIKDYIDSFHLMHYTNEGEDYFLKIYKLTDMFSHYFTVFQTSMMVLGMTLFTVLPIYNNYNMGAFNHPRDENLTLDFSVLLEFPGLIQEEHFHKATIFNFYLCYNCSSSTCCIDLLLYLMVFQLIGRIKLLLHKVEHIPRPKKSVTFHSTSGLPPVCISAQIEMFDDEENQSIHLKLIEIVNDHRKIVSFTDLMSSFFGPVLGLNYLLHLVGGCILLLECSQKDPEALARFAPLTFIIFGQLIQLSVVFEVVGYMSEKLIDSVYLMPWECMSVNNQKSIRFILSRIQIPIEVTALGSVPVGVRTMLLILKTTLSYFAFLQTFRE